MVLVFLWPFLIALDRVNIQPAYCLHFTDITDQAGVGDASTSVGVAFCDYDRDNNLDIYVTTYPGKNRLYHNLCNNKFTDVASVSGIDDPNGNGEGMVWADIDNDGLKDLFICNEYTPNRLSHNDGKGHFTDITNRAGISDNAYGEGVQFGDFNKVKPCQTGFTSITSKRINTQQVINSYSLNRFYDSVPVVSSLKGFDSFISSKPNNCRKPITI